jgi:hypothetical protein
VRHRRSLPCWGPARSREEAIRGGVDVSGGERASANGGRRQTFDEQLEMLRAREKAHTREGDAIAAARRRLPMVEVAGDGPLLGPHAR